MYGMSNNISRPNIAEPGEALSTVWYVERMAHAASYIYVHLCHWLSPLGHICLGGSEDLHQLLDEFSPVLHSFVGSLSWFAYA